MTNRATIHMFWSPDDKAGVSMNNRVITMPERRFSDLLEKVEPGTIIGLYVGGSEFVEYRNYEEIYEILKGRISRIYEKGASKVVLVTCHPQCFFEFPQRVELAERLGIEFMGSRKPSALKPSNLTFDDLEYVHNQKLI